MFTRKNQAKTINCEGPELHLDADFFYPYQTGLNKFNFLLARSFRKKKNFSQGKNKYLCCFKL